MKALLSVKSGGPDSLELRDLPMPEPGPGEVRVRVLGCAINYPDVLIIEDKYQVKPARPFAPGGEISGVIDAIGPDVQGWTIGNRIIALCTHGGLAEQIIIPAADAIALPDDLDPVGAAALLFTYGTTIHALMDRAALQAGETLLILGASGGVGLAAIELGKALGAKVVAAVSSADKAQAARDAGADHALIYDRGPFDKDGVRALADAFKAAVGPAGADVIYDPVGGDYAEAALRSIAWEGRYLVIGFPAGIPRIPLNLPLLKSCDIRGVFWGAFTKRRPEHFRQQVAQLFAWWREGRIAPKISDVYPLERAGEAIATLSGRAIIGKAVVTPNGAPPVTKS